MTSTRLLRIEMDDEAVERLAAAIASPAARRFAASGVVGEVVAGARARLLELAWSGGSGRDAGERLLAGWREQLVELEAPLDGEDRQRWVGVAATALTLSAIAGLPDELSPAASRELAGDDVLAGAVLSHALGVLHRPGELPRLLADPLEELEAHRAHVGELFWAAEAAAAIANGDGEEGPWLRLELEEAAALAAAAAAALALFGESR